MDKVQVTLIALKTKNLKTLFIPIEKVRDKTNISESSSLDYQII